MWATQLKYFQDVGTSGYTGGRCQPPYSKWNTLYIITFLNLQTKYFLFRNVLYLSLTVFYVFKLLCQKLRLQT